MGDPASLINPIIGITETKEKDKMTATMTSRETIKIRTNSGMLYIASMEEASKDSPGSTFLYCVVEDRDGNILHNFEIPGDEAQRLLPMIENLSKTK